MTTTYTRRSGVLLATALALTLTACGAGALEDEDPAGHQACIEYMVKSYDDATEDDALVVLMGGNSIAAEFAVDATTDAIRESADASIPDAGLYILDGVELVAACSEHGYEIEEHSPAWWGEQNKNS